MAEPSAQEVLEWALINRARLDPVGEAARFGIDLNEGLSSGTISSTSKQPLAFSLTLFASADVYSQAMIDRDFFAHIDPQTGSTPQSRGNAAGYAGRVGENIAWRGSTGAIDATQMAIALDKDLFVDSGVSGRGHRTNMLNADYQEIGVGQVIGLFTSQGTTYNASMLTVDFGIPSATGQFLLGLAYIDTNADGFYSVGEGRGGITVSGGASATTGTAGAYSALVGSDQQTLTFAGGNLASPVSIIANVISGRNAMVNLVGADTVETSTSITALNGVTKIIGLGNLGLTLTGNALDNTIVSALGNDAINGGAGFDTVIYSSVRSAYTVTTAGDLTTVRGADGTDTLKSIEQLKFTDQVVALVDHFNFSAPSSVSTSFGSSDQAGGWISQDHYPRHVADVNGDGLGDLVGFGYAGAYVSLAKSDGTFKPVTALALDNFGASDAAGGWISQNRYPRMMGDVNGDGRSDIVGFGYAGTYVSLANSDGTFKPATALALSNFGVSDAAGGWISQDRYPRMLGDVNGDGRADIVGFGYAGVYASFANSDGTFKPVTALATNSFGTASGWVSNNANLRTMGDVNGDGKADIIGFGGDGVYVGIAKSDGTFNAPSALASNFFGTSEAAGGWSNNSLTPREVIDVNGDHRVDIVGFGINDVLLAHSDWLV